MKGVPTCTEALRQFMAWRKHLRAPTTVESQGHQIAIFLRDAKLGDQSVVSVTLSQVNDYINTSEPIRVATREFRRWALVAFFKFCNAQGWTQTNFALICEVRKRDLPHNLWHPVPRIAITPDEYRLIMAHTSGFWHYATAISYWVGLRLVDIVNLEWEAISSDSIFVMVKKNERPLALPLNDPLLGAGELIPVFLKMLEGQIGQYCFPTMRRRFAASGRARREISWEYTKILRRLAEETELRRDSGGNWSQQPTGLPSLRGKTFHCLRHAFAMRLKAAGREMEQVARLMGHASIETTKGYGNY